MSLSYDHKGNRKYLSLEERANFLEAARGMPPDVYAFCLTLAYTGARISEALRLKRQHIDSFENVVVLETLKKRQSGVFRSIPVPVDVIERILTVSVLRCSTAEQESSDALLWPWGRTTAWKYIKFAMAAARIDGPHATARGLRHSFAVTALQEGLPITLIRKWLGHSRLTTTELYLDAVGREERHYAENFWKSFGR